MFNTDNNSSSKFSNVYLECPVTSKANFYSTFYQHPPSLRRKSANGSIFQTFSQRTKTQTLMTSSKSVFTSSNNHTPTCRPLLVRSPQPLSVMGFRTDMLVGHQKQLLPPTKSPKAIITNANSPSHIMKHPSMKAYNYRWKTKPATNARVNNYPDPLYNADIEFMQRISEMAGLEVETIKSEKTKKTKRR